MFKVTVKEIRSRVLPELNDEFFKDLGYDNIKTADELKKELESQIRARKEKDAENKYIDDLMSAAISKMTVEINEEIIHDEIHRMMHDLSHRLEMQGITLDNYFKFSGITEEAFHEQAKPEAINRIKSRYLLDEIIAKEKLEATDEEVISHANEQAKLYGTTANEIIEMYGGLEVVKYDVLIHKAIKVLEEE